MPPLFLLDTNNFAGKAKELGVCESQVGQLVTPLNGNANQFREAGFAIDNGAFAAFNEKRWRARLARELPNRDKCHFVVCPDVVGSARRTLELFSHFYPSLHGWRIALACQDGQEDLPIQWDLIDAVFIGGSTEWKVSRHSEAIIKSAKALGKWVHVGRVNSANRYQWCCRMGVDSIDGTGLTLYTANRKRIKDCMELREFDFEVPQEKEVVRISRGVDIIRNAKQTGGSD